MKGAEGEEMKIAATAGEVKKVICGLGFSHLLRAIRIFQHFTADFVVLVSLQTPAG